jgi:alkylated DNA nucleotide flippase Atl1
VTTGRCVHGLDPRFCSLCQKAAGTHGSSLAAARVTLPEILAFLNEKEIRATYGAVAGVLGLPPRSLGAALGSRRPEASWIVNAESELPTDYDHTHIHPALFRRSEVIRTQYELVLRMSAWKTRRR